MAEHEAAGIGRRQFVQAGAATGAALLGGGGLAMAAEAANPAVVSGMSADDVIKLLDLQPNATCGFVRVTFLSPLSIAPGGLPAPFANGRPLGSALYFLVTPHAPVRLHRIRNGQLYHYYLGDPLEVFMLHNDGTVEHVVVGPDLRNGQRVQLHIPGDTFHTARLVAGGQWFLGGSTEWPGVVPAEDVEIGDLDALAAKYPSAAADMRAIAASVRDVVAPGGPR
jgi:predicted cupin superfamily sugar epimerase